jgi:murein DD-endopeptidase MepM/ murein hydrolase activator NlpD
MKTHWAKRWARGSAIVIGVALTSCWATAHGLAQESGDSWVQVGQELVPNPVPSGQGCVNPRVPEVHQGGGWFDAPRGDRRHAGLDLSEPAGTPVRAPVSGWVIRSTTDGNAGYGNEVRVLDSQGRVHLFAHLAGLDQIESGTYVNAGDTIGYTGRSGNTPSQAAGHLHYEVRDRNNQPIRVQPNTDGNEASRWQGFENYVESLPRRRSTPRSNVQPGRTTTPGPAPGAAPGPAAARQDIAAQGTRASDASAVSPASAPSTPRREMTLAMDDNAPRDLPSIDQIRNSSAMRQGAANASPGNDRRSPASGAETQPASRTATNVDRPVSAANPVRVRPSGQVGRTAQTSAEPAVIQRRPGTSSGTASLQF